MRPYVFSLLFLIALTSGLSVIERASAAGAACESPTVHVRNATPEEAALACAGIADARAFFDAHGFDTDIVIDISVQPRVSAGTTRDLAFTVLGQFRPDLQRVSLTSLATQRHMAETHAVFKVPFESAQFREVVAHEVAHAIAEHNFTRREPSRLVHEYIAYIVQMVTMAPERRARILAAFDTKPFATELEINPMAYAIAPDVFAVKAYLYFTAQPDGAAYLRKIMAEDLPGAMYTMDFLG